MYSGGGKISATRSFPRTMSRYKGPLTLTALVRLKDTTAKTDKPALNNPTSSQSFLLILMFRRNPYIAMLRSPSLLCRFSNFFLKFRVRMKAFVVPYIATSMRPQLFATRCPHGLLAFVLLPETAGRRLCAIRGGPRLVLELRHQVLQLRRHARQFCRRRLRVTRTDRRTFGRLRYSRHVLRDLVGSLRCLRHVATDLVGGHRLLFHRRRNRVRDVVDLFLLLADLGNRCLRVLRAVMDRLTLAADPFGRLAGV